MSRSYFIAAFHSRRTRIVGASVIVVIASVLLVSAARESGNAPPHRQPEVSRLPRQAPIRLASALSSGPEAPKALDESELLMRLRSLTETLEAEGDSAITGHRLRALLVKYPQASEIVSSLLEEGLDHTAATTLVFELGKAGTPLAQKALAEVYNSEDQSTRLRRQALIAAGGVVRPTGDTRASLWQVYSSSAKHRSHLAPAALLGLGRIGATLRDQESEAYKSERSQLLAVLQDSENEGTTILALKALGNTHDALLSTAVSPYLSDTSSRIRAVAADALGRLGGAQAAALLVRRLLAERVGWVRRSVVVALRQLDEPSNEAIATIVRLLPTEADDTVAAEMRRVLEENGA